MSDHNAPYTSTVTTSGVADCPCCGMQTMVEDFTRPELCEDCGDADCDPTGCSSCELNENLDDDWDDDTSMGEDPLQQAERHWQENQRDTPVREW